MRRCLPLLLFLLLAGCPPGSLANPGDDLACGSGNGCDLADAPSDLAANDLAANDLAGVDAQPAVIVVEPIWIGSGGVASSAQQQLSIGIGGIDTVGTVAAPSGAKLTSGFFSSQTN